MFDFVQFAAKRDLPQSVVLEWLKSGADFTGGEIEDGQSSSRSPLGMLATRKDGPKLLTALPDPLEGVISSNLHIMLKAAVMKGTAEMVQVYWPYKISWLIPICLLHCFPSSL